MFNRIYCTLDVLFNTLGWLAYSGIGIHSKKWSVIYSKISKGTVNKQTSLYSKASISR